MALLLQRTVLRAEEPYSYSTLPFNHGMNPAAGLLAGDLPIDVQNALWDASGFMYTRSAFRRFNGRQRSLAPNNFPVKGLYRFVKTPFPPDEPGLGRFMAACSLYVYSDSSITDTNQAFKKEGIGFHGSYFEDRAVGAADGAADSEWVVWASGNFANDPWRRIIPMEPYFKTIDSCQFLRANPAGGGAFFLPLVTWIQLDLFLTQGTSTADTFFNYRIRSTLDPRALTQFVQLGNTTIFGDSTKPLRFYNGNDTDVTVGFIADEVSDQTVNTTMGNGTKAWFDDQWVAYWMRFVSAPPTVTRNGVTRYTAPFAPITANNDTLLYLRFDPTFDGLGLICSFPIEMMSKPYQITQTDGSGQWIRLSGLPSNWNLWNSTNTIEARNCSYPLEVLFVDTLHEGKTRMVSYIFGDTLWFAQDPVPSSAQGKVRLLVHRPVIPRCMAIHQNRLWVVDVANPNRVYYSEPLQPEAIGPFNYVDVFPRDGDKINALASYKDQLLTKKSNSVERVVGDNPSNFVVLPFLENLGTAGLNSNAQSGGDDYFYDPQTGLYVLREFNPVRLSDPVKPLFDSIPAGAANKVALAIYKNNLWMTYPAGAGQTKNNRLVSLNLTVKDSWSRHSFAEVGVMNVWPLAGDSTRLVAGDQDSGTVYVYTEGATQEHIPADTGRTVKLLYKTGWMDISGPELRKRLRQFQLSFDMNASADRDSVFLYRDFATSAFDTLVFSKDVQLNNYALNDVKMAGLGRKFQLQMECAPSDIARFYYGRMKWVNASF